jgi:hypothetical protein
MASPSLIDKIKQEISVLETRREDLYKQTASVEQQLTVKNKLMETFKLVTTDADLYKGWKDQLAITPPPVTGPPNPPNPPNPPGPPIPSNIPLQTPISTPPPLMVLPVPRQTPISTPPPLMVLPVPPQTPLDK